jgi:hypothetical protein
MWCWAKRSLPTPKRSRGLSGKQKNHLQPSKKHSVKAFFKSKKQNPSILFLLSLNHKNHKNYSKKLREATVKPKKHRRKNRNRA